MHVNNSVNNVVITSDIHLAISDTKMCKATEKSNSDHVNKSVNIAVQQSQAHYDGDIAKHITTTINQDEAWYTYAFE